MTVMIDGQAQYVGRTIQVVIKAEYEDALVMEEDGSTKWIKVRDGAYPTEDATPEVLEILSNQHKAAAQRYHDRAEESFQRCDTDGFLTQWALQQNAELERLRAGLAKDGYQGSFIGLYEGDRRVKAKEISTQYGTCWLLHEDEKALIAKRGKPFLPTGNGSRILKGLGLEERDETAPAYAKHGKHRPYIFRTGDQWGGDAVLCEEA